MEKLILQTKGKMTGEWEDNLVLSKDEFRIVSRKTVETVLNYPCIEPADPEAEFDPTFEPGDKVIVTDGEYSSSIGIVSRVEPQTRGAEVVIVIDNHLQLWLRPSQLRKLK